MSLIAEIGCFYAVGAVIVGIAAMRSEFKSHGKRIPFVGPLIVAALWPLAIVALIRGKSEWSW